MEHRKKPSEQYVLLNRQRNRVSVMEVIAIAAKTFCMDPDRILSRRRDPATCAARSLAMFAAWKFGAHQGAIAIAFGRVRSSVQAAIRRVDSDVRTFACASEAYTLMHSAVETFIRNRK